MDMDLEQEIFGDAQENVPEEDGVDHEWLKSATLVRRGVASSDSNSVHDLSLDLSRLLRTSPLSSFLRASHRARSRTGCG